MTMLMEQVKELQESTSMAVEKGIIYTPGAFCNAYTQKERAGVMVIGLMKRERRIKSAFPIIFSCY
jgi:hypothetical protein